MCFTTFNAYCKQNKQTTNQFISLRFSFLFLFCCSVLFVFLFFHLQMKKDLQPYFYEDVLWLVIRPKVISHRTKDEVPSLFRHYYLIEFLIVHYCFVFVLVLLYLKVVILCLFMCLIISCLLFMHLCLSVFSNLLV